MYSAVLMLALTAGNEAIDFGRCNSCSNSCSYSSCSSSGHGLFNRGHGCTTYTCSTGCSVSYGCNSCCQSSCHGGGLFNRRNRHCSSSCYSSCSYSSCSYYGGGTCSGVIVVPATPETKKKEMPKGEKIEGPKKDETATIIINLPADARLTVDGAATTSTTDRRILVTPTLAVGSTYVYTMQAEITREGRVITEAQQVTVRPGETSNVQFSFPQAVASR